MPPMTDMNCIFTLSVIPCCYWKLAAAAITVYQAYRGYRFQWLFGLGSANNNNDRWAAHKKPQINLRDLERVFLLSLADCFTYAVCALSGSYAILIAYSIAKLPDTKTPLAHPVVFIFLLLYGVLGVTGKMPDTLDRIKGPTSLG
jgi:hypothetical protein